MLKKMQSSAAESKAARKKAKKTIRTAVAALSSILILMMLTLLSGCDYLFDTDGTILENVSVAGVDVGGMTQDEAVNAVNAVASVYESSTMTVKVFDKQVELTPAETGAKLNVSRAVREAYKYGRRGFSGQKQKDLEMSQNGGIVVDISPYLSLNSRAIKNTLEKFGEHYKTTLSQSTYEVTGTAPELTLVVHLGVPEYTLDLDALYKEVMDAYSRKNFLLETECELIAPSPIDLKAILDKHYVAPENAKFNDKFEVIEEKNGCGFDIDAVQKKLDETPYGETVKIPFDVIPPEETGEQLSALLYRDTLGKHTGSQSSSSNRQTNLRLACESINGVIVYPGEIFSYNRTLGERTTEKGYKTGIAYVGGKSVPSIGGGICQVSSTLYYCALQADLEILARECHSYAPGYVPLGMDATVSWGSLDFSFRNTTDYPIRIEAQADGGTVSVALHGTDTKDHYIKMEYVVSEYYSYKTTYETYPANNSKGYKDGDYIVSPCNGYKVLTYRCKYDKTTNELISRDFEDTSVFATRDAVICKIEGAPSDDNTGNTDPSQGIGNGGVTDDSGELPQ